MAGKEHKHITITRAYWADDPQTPEQLRQSAARRSAADGATRLLVHGDEWCDDAGDYLQYRAFLQQADKDVIFRAKGQADVKGRVTTALFTQASRQLREIEVAISKEEYAKMAKGVPYTVHAANAVPGYQWRVKDGVTITRPK